MSKFRYLEVAIQHPSNRNHFFLSKEAIDKPFLKSNRFTEFWRSMFLYSSTSPTEEDAMFGNFYVECDISDFQKNRSVMLEVADFLFKNFKIPYHYMDYFRTNRSIWLTVPAKVFGCYGSKNLHQVYKKMAEDIQSYLDKKIPTTAIDLSIYKWNGLIHSLGSYLPQKDRWVTKFSHSQLEDAYTEIDVLEAEYDNFSLFDDVEEIEAAKNWFYSKKKDVFSLPASVSFEKSFSCERTCMKNLEEAGTIDENRNLHIYSYSLYLKELGYDTQSAIERVQSVFDISYVNLRECKRTVQSAIEGTKRFNCAVVKQLLNPELFDCESCSITNKQNADTFIVPRVFIEKLNAAKAHYDTYKWLLEVLHCQQVDKTTYKVNLSGQKYKKLIISRLQTLEDTGIAKLEIKNDMVEMKLISQEREIYQSHIVVPKKFISDKRFLSMKHEIKLLLELWRVSLLSGKKQRVLSFNVKVETLLRNLKMTGKTFWKLLASLKKERLVFGKQIFVFLSSTAIKEKVRSFIQKVKKSRTGVKPVKLKRIVHSEMDTKYTYLSNGLSFKPKQELVTTYITGFLSIL